METTRGNIYDYPQYYDLVYGSDWKSEFDFLLQCFEEHALVEVRRIFEPACGTGRLLYRLANAGFKTSGLDLNPHAIEYCNKRLERNGFSRSAFVEDMTDFKLRKKIDAAFNMINSFRHLTSQTQAKAHLHCVAEALNPGGIYVLGIHLTPTAAEPSQEESWSAQRGHLCVNTHMWLIDQDLTNRQERFGMTFDIYTPTKNFRLQDELVFRTYTAKQFERLLASDDDFEIAEVYDFCYEIDHPIEIKPETEDVVYILRKRFAS